MSTTTVPVSDIFISYSRADNKPIEGHDFGWVDLLKQRLEEEDRRHGKGDLKIFLDKTDLQPMDTWPHVLRKRLRQSKILLACISPNFLRSRYCRDEWDYYHRVHNLFGDFDGVASVYFVDVLQDEFSDYDQSWRERVGKTHRIDFMQWFQEGKGALERGDFQPTIEVMYQRLQKRIADARLRERVPGNLETGNEFFVGREDKLDEVRYLVESGIRGRVTLITGFGGMGKSSLAVEYANRAKGLHQCGVWQLNAEGYTDPLALLGDALFTDPYLNIPDTENNRVLRANPVEAGRLVLHTLHQKIQETSLTYQEQANVLLLFDNVTQSAFLADGKLKNLPDSEHVRYIATSRLDNQHWRNSSSRVEPVDLDKLEEPAALELLLSRQRDRLDFRDDADREAARDIVTNLLDGYTLAIEQVAVFMAGQTAASTGPKTFVQMNQSLRKLGVVSIDEWMRKHKARHDGVIRHREQCLSTILNEFVLPRLDAMARQALQYAVCMPATHIPLTWLEGLTQTDSPEADQPLAGLDSPWNDALWLLTENQLIDEKRTYAPDRRPVATMHQVIRDHLAREYHTELPDRRQHILRVIATFVNTLREQQAIPPEDDLQDVVTLLATLLQEVPDEMVSFVGIVDYLFTQSITHAVALPVAVELMQQVKTYLRNQLTQDTDNTDWQRELSVTLSKLGAFYLRLGETERARQHYEEDLDISRRLVDRDGGNTDWQRELSVALSKLGDFYVQLGEVQHAYDSYQEALALLADLVGKDQTHVGWLFDQAYVSVRLGDLLVAVGHKEAARSYYQEAEAVLAHLLRIDPTNQLWLSWQAYVREQLNDLTE